MPRFVRNFLIALAASTPLYFIDWYAREPEEEPETVIIDSEALDELQKLINEAAEEHRKLSRSEPGRRAYGPVQRKLHKFLTENKDDLPSSSDTSSRPDAANGSKTPGDTDARPLRNFLDDG